MLSATSKVVLDANILVPVSLSDFILRCAEKGMFSPVWSSSILDEALAHALKLNDAAKESGIRRRFSLMNKAFPTANIQEPLQNFAQYGLPDDGDEHVLRTAIRAKAAIIITQNIKDFPDEILLARHLIAVNVDDFLLLLTRYFSKTVNVVLAEMIKDFNNPRISMEELLTSLEKEGASRFAVLARTQILKQ